MHRYLVRQKLNYVVYQVEPMANLTFNRGLLMNIGFRIATTSPRVDEPNWQCFIFHDVDNIPELLNVPYTCNEHYPIELSVAVNRFNYRYINLIEHFKMAQFEIFKKIILLNPVRKVGMDNILVVLMRLPGSNLSVLMDFLTYILAGAEKVMSFF